MSTVQFYSLFQSAPRKVIIETMDVPSAFQLLVRFVKMEEQIRYGGLGIVLAVAGSQEGLRAAVYKGNGPLHPDFILEFNNKHDRRDRNGCSWHNTDTNVRCSC